MFLMIQYFVDILILMYKMSIQFSNCKYFDVDLLETLFHNDLFFFALRGRQCEHMEVMFMFFNFQILIAHFMNFSIPIVNQIFIFQLSIRYLISGERLGRVSEHRNQSSGVWIHFYHEVFSLKKHYSLTMALQNEPRTFANKTFSRK